MPQSRLGLKRYKPRTGPTGKPKKPKKPKYTTSFHKSKAAAKKDKGKPNTPGEKMREYKGKMTMGQIRNKKTFAGETGLEGMKKKLNYQRRGKASGGSVAKDTHVTKDGRTVKKGLYYYMDQAKKSGKSRPGKGTVTDKALKQSAKTAKKK